MKMRNYLFRGQDFNGRWVKGSLIQRHGAAYIVDSVRLDSMYVPVTCHAKVDVCPVLPSTIGQFTGLTDADGHEIFEGDIVECCSEGVQARGTVQQRKDGMWIIYPSWQNYIMWTLAPDQFLHTTVKVIGNEINNPELVVKMRTVGE